MCPGALCCSALHASDFRVRRYCIIACLSVLQGGTGKGVAVVRLCNAKSPVWWCDLTRGRRAAVRAEIVIKEDFWYNEGLAGHSSQLTPPARGGPLSFPSRCERGLFVSLQTAPILPQARKRGNSIRRTSMRQSRWRGRRSRVLKRFHRPPASPRSPENAHCRSRIPRQDRTRRAAARTPIT